MCVTRIDELDLTNQMSGSKFGSFGGDTKNREGDIRAKSGDIEMYIYEIDTEN